MSARFVGTDRWMCLSLEITLIGRCRERRETVFYATSSVHAFVSQRKRERDRKAETEKEERDLMDETKRETESIDETRKRNVRSGPIGLH